MLWPLLILVIPKFEVSVPPFAPDTGASNVFVADVRSQRGKKGREYVTVHASARRKSPAEHEQIARHFMVQKHH